MNALLELVDVVGQVEDHQSCVLQSNLTHKPIFIVLHTNLLLRLQHHHRHLAYQQRRTTPWYTCHGTQLADVQHNLRVGFNIVWSVLYER